MFHVLTLEFGTREKAAKIGSKLRLEKLTELWSKAGASCYKLEAPSWMENLQTVTAILFWLLYAPLEIIKIYKRSRFHILLCNSHNFYNLLPTYISSKILKVPYAVTVHHIPEVELAKNPIQVYKSCIHNGFEKIDALLFSFIFPVNRKILSHSKHVVTVSGASKKAIEKLGIKNVKISYNGIDKSLLERDNYVVDNAKIYDAVYVGRLDPLKGIFDLIKIWSNVTKEMSEAKLIVIGSGYPKYVQKLKVMIKSHKLSGNVILAGSVPDEDKFSLLSLSKVFLLPSYAEGFSIVISEALSLRLPVVAYELPALLEVYGRCPAISYVKKGNYEIFAKSILLLLQKEKLRRNLGRVGFEYSKALSEKLTWEYVAEDLIQFLLHVSRARSTPGRD